MFLALISTGGCSDGTLVALTPTTDAVVGKLMGEIKDSATCLWVEDSTGNRTYFMLPAGLMEGAEPFRVSKGANTLAQAGDIVRIMGTGLTGPGVGDTACAPGHRPMVVSQFERVGP